LSIAAMTRWVTMKKPVRLTPRTSWVIVDGVVRERLANEDARLAHQRVDAPEAPQ